MKRSLRIALYSHAFYPAIGGLESVSLVLATEFARLGHQVRIITLTGESDSSADRFPFAIVRGSSRRLLWQTIAWSDVYFQNNLSLPALWPVFLLRKPWVVAHQTWSRNVDGTIDAAARCKILATRLASASVSISQAIANQFSSPQRIIGNPYDAILFRELPEVPKTGDLVFVGRLVSDKGVDLLLEALGVLARKALHPGLTIIGDGPELIPLQELAKRLGLQEKVTFTGARRGTELVRLLNQHRIMVVPSRWEEPYGIVALEGLATGCVIVGSAAGGLPDAIGGCGLTFPNGDLAALAGELEKLLTQPALALQLRSGAAAHLDRQSPQSVAEAYLRIFQEVARTRT